MAIKETSPRNLADREQRALARLARIARGDVVHGGARAMVLAARLKRSSAPFGEVVGDAYASASGSATRFLAYACPECGSAHMGQEAALACCNQSDEEQETRCDCGEPAGQWTRGMCAGCFEEWEDKQ